MRTFEADGVPHRTRALTAYDQFHLLQAVMPILPAIAALDLATGDISPEGIAGLMGAIEPSAITAAFVAAAGAAERDDGEGWHPATKAVSLPDMLTTALAVIDANLSDYLSRKQPEFRPTPHKGLDFTPASMPDGESWLMRPVLKGIIPPTGLTDGVYTLWHFAKVNDAMDVDAENEARAYKAAEKG